MVSRSNFKLAGSYKKCTLLFTQYLHWEVNEHFTDRQSYSMSMANFLPLVLLAIVLLRCEAAIARYDPSGRIYPWPLPADRKAIFFSLIVSFGENFNSSGVVPGVNVALDIINSNDSNLLNGYSLHYFLSDSKVGHGMIASFLHRL
jgi:hypothetical protein